jgi:hypothetical protein
MAAMAAKAESLEVCSISGSISDSYSRSISEAQRYKVQFGHIHRPRPCII